MKFHFPKNFYWGSASSAHQTEGETFNQWSVWEKSLTRKQSLEKKGLLKKHVYENFISGRNSDHYHLYEIDFDLAKQLGHNALRFSLEWSRIQPQEGVWNEEGIEHYRKILDALHVRNLQPFLTLWHWTHPVWFEEKGGWLCAEAEDLFVDYGKKIIDVFGDRFTFFITLNEPEIYASFSYLIGVWPPQKISFFSFYSVMKKLLNAHRRIYRYAKEKYPHMQIGIAKNYAYFEVSLYEPINIFYEN